MKAGGAYNLIALVIAFSAAGIAPSAAMESDEADAAQLIGRIEYRFVGHQQQTDASNRLLVWEAVAEGDLNGEMKWWFVVPPPVDEVAYTDGRITFYSARWELWADDELLLAGHSVGKTDFRNGADGIWDGHGRVTEAAAQYQYLLGHAIYETGPVLLGAEPPQSFSGTGMFLVY
jgi:hypothetical protein